MDWRHIWRVAGRESASRELLESSWTSPEVPRTSPEVGDFPGSSLTLVLNSNPELPGSFPDFPGSSPDFPGSFPDFPGGQPLSMGSLTPSPDSQELSLNGSGQSREIGKGIAAQRNQTKNSSLKGARLSLFEVSALNEPCTERAPTGDRRDTLP